MGIQIHELPANYAKWSFSIFSGLEPLLCRNETSAVAELNSLPCTVQPLCGFSTWQEACLRVQLAEASRATQVFLLTFPITVLAFWAVYTMYSHGLGSQVEPSTKQGGKEKERQSLIRRSSITLKRHTTRRMPIVPSEVDEAEEEPSGRSPSTGVRTESLRKEGVAASRRSRGGAALDASGSGGSGSGGNQTGGGPSYSHLFQPHMLLAFFLIVVRRHT